MSRQKHFSIPTIIYSSDATDFSTHYLNAGCSAIIYGEGEITLKETVEAFDKNIFNELKKSIPGLKFLNNNEIYITPQRKIIDDLDTLPVPDYSFVDIESYRDIWLKNHGYFSLNISTTRGCPYSCNWCAKPLYGRSYQSKSPSTTSIQIQELKDKYSIDHLWITDDIFGLKPLWLKEFAKECKKLKFKISYKCLSRPDLLLRENTIDLLKETGCTTIWIGAESGSQKILDAMDKGTGVEQIFDAASKVKEAGMEIAFFIQFGYSGEVWEDIVLTRNMIKKCLPDDIGVSVSYPLPGTKFYERVKNEFKGKTNWKDSDDLDMIFHGTYERNFYKLLHRLVHSEYRMFQIIKKKEIRKYLHLIYHRLKYIYFRIRINRYLKQPNGQAGHEESSFKLQNNPT